MARPARLRLPTIFLAIGAALALTGCATVTEDLATHLAEHELKLDHDLQVIHGDLALFKQCFHERGGQCSGGAETALPNTTNAASGTPVTSAKPGASQHLSDSVAKLPPGHPAKSAHAVLKHPVTQKAAAVHDQLRGVAGSDPTPGVTMTSDGSGTSTIDMSLPIKEVKGFHAGLHGAASGGGWDALHGHCQTQIQSGGATGSARDHLERDCRTVAFIRTYLEAYFRQGEFVKVELGLSGVTTDVNAKAVAVYQTIKTLNWGFQQLQQQAAGATSTTELQSDYQALTQLAQISTTALQSVAGAVGKSLGDLLGREVDLTSDLLAPPKGSSSTASTQQMQEAVTSLGDEIAWLEQGFEDLGKKVQALAADVEGAINDLVGDANKKLSNVFKVDQVGFVSRDSTYRAQLPTIEIQFDPTVKKHMLTVEDASTHQTITSQTHLADLGVATDKSGVGSGFVAPSPGVRPSSQIGIELVRVFLEAVFDAPEGLPAMAPVNQGAKTARATAPTGLSIQPDAYSLTAFQDPTGNVSSADFTKMTKLNSRVAGAVSSELGSVIGGVGPFSLNNPNLENFIVEIVSTTVRKVVEKASWCWYACNLDQALEQAEKDAEAALEAELKKLEDEAKAEAKKEEKKVKALFKKEAEIVRLKLRLSS